MRAPELITHISRSLELLIESADELRDLDQTLGDGDLGITVTAGSRAIIEALGELGDDVTPTDVARVCAKAFANANPSTMAALVAGGLLAGSRVWEASTDVTVDDAAKFATAVADSIAQRGKTQVGDKTILDGIAAVTAAIGAAGDAAAATDAAVVAASQAVADTTELQSRRGRASWLQERSIGHPDPGATAFLRFVEAWAAAGS